MFRNTLSRFALAVIILILFVIIALGVGIKTSEPYNNVIPISNVNTFNIN